MGGFVNKMLNFMGINDGEYDPDEDYVEEEEVEEDDEEREYKETPSLFGRRKNVAMLPGMQNVRVVISQPNSYDQASEICEHLKGKKSIIVNLEYVNKDVARRIIDFMSGAVYALDGNIQKISNSIFLIAPYNYEITNEVIKETVEKKASSSSVSWIK